MWQTQPSFVLDAKLRLNLYNNWQHRDWARAESELQIWYHQGLGEFVNFEKTHLRLIDLFHPCMFEQECQKKILWSNHDVWPYILFVKYQTKSFDHIINLAASKRKDLNHHLQIPNEIESMQRLMWQIPGHLEIWWEDMLELETYLPAIDQLAKTMNLVLNLDLVATLWKNWNYHTKIIDARH